MNTKQFSPRARVAYIPSHANGDVSHADVEHGFVSSLSQNGKTVFVKFDRQLEKFGWDGTTSQGCDPSDLRVLFELL